MIAMSTVLNLDGSNHAKAQLAQTPQSLRLFRPVLTASVSAFSKVDQSNSMAGLGHSPSVPLLPPDRKRM